MGQKEINREVFGARLAQLLAERGETTYTVAAAVGLSSGTISRYCNGLIGPKLATLYLLADYFRVDPDWLMGTEGKSEPAAPRNLVRLKPHRVPLLGSIAAGEPIFGEQAVDCYVDSENDGADFALRIKGDSMIGARIYDGDLVFIHAQDDVDDGEIAAVMIDDEATLKRVFKLGDRVILRAENPAYAPFEYSAHDGKNLRILGKAIAFQGQIR